MESLGIKICWFSFTAAFICVIGGKVFSNHKDAFMFAAVGFIILMLIGFVLYKFGPRETVELENGVRTERLFITSGAIVIGDSYIPMPGESIENVPNGWCEIQIVVERATVMRFQIDFGRGEGERTLQTCDFTIDGGVAMIADPRGGEAESKSQLREIENRFMRELYQSMRNDERGAAYTHAFDDAAGRPWAVVMTSGIGDGAYGVAYEIAGGIVTSMRCEFIAWEEE